MRQGFIQSNPVLVEKFVRGTLKGLRYAREHRAATISILARNIRTKEDLATKDYDLSRPGMTAEGPVDEIKQKRYSELGAKRLGITEVPPNKKVSPFSITRIVNSQLDIKQWRPEDSMRSSKVLLSANRK